MSQEQVPPDPELTATEAALGSLAPARSGLDRDRLMFEAGQRSPRSATRGRFAWPSLAASLAVVALGEAAALAYRPEPRVIERVVVLREPAPALSPSPVPSPVVILRQATPAPPSAAPAEFSQAETESERLRRQVLQLGIDGLPEPPPFAFQSHAGAAGAKPEPSGVLLRSEIAKLLTPGEPL